MKLLLAEDEYELSRALKVILGKQHFVVETVDNGQDALDYARLGNYDGLIFDVMLPKMDGFKALEILRSEGIETPCLFLTARTAVEDRISGLNLGADDYLMKPFDSGELIARIRAMLRRKTQFTPDELHFGDLVLNTGRCELSCGDLRVSPSNKEFQILRILLENSKQILSAEQLFDAVWEADSDQDSSIIWVYISKLRTHLATLKSKVKIQASRGIGYRLEYKENEE